MMSFDVSPYFSMRSSALPDSPNVSFVPILMRGAGHCSESNSATADPSPPMMLCSSAVIAHPVLETDFLMHSVSSGLMVETLMTSALMPLDFSESAASRHAATI